MKKHFVMLNKFIFNTFLSGDTTHNYFKGRDIFIGLLSGQCFENNSLVGWPLNLTNTISLATKYLYLCISHPLEVDETTSQHEFDSHHCKGPISSLT
jgi:hypothetical protein